VAHKGCGRLITLHLGYKGQACLFSRHVCSVFSEIDEQVNSGKLLPGVMPQCELLMSGVAVTVRDVRTPLVCEVRIRYSLRSSRKHRHETHHRAASLRSRRQNKTWGASPRITKNKLSLQPVKRAAESECLSADARIRGLKSKLITPWILGLAPQALCLRPLRRL